MDGLETYLLEIRRLLKQVQVKSASAGKETRAREAEDKLGKDGRLKSRGRVIKTEASKADGAPGSATPMSNDTTEMDDDDGLGGCKLSKPTYHALLTHVLQMVSSMQACCCKH